MQASTPAGRIEPSAARNEQFVRDLGELLNQINTLQILAGGEQEEETIAPIRDPSALRQGLRSLAALANDILYEAQVGGSDLHLGALPQGLRLAEALSQLVEDTAETLGLSSRVIFAGQERPLADYRARLLYRIVQEALSRLATHVGMHRLRFSLDYQDAEILLKIEDDGFPDERSELSTDASDNTDTAATFPPFLTPEEEAGSVTPRALNQLRRMIEEFGGTLTLSSEIEQGSQVQVRIPYEGIEGKTISAEKASGGTTRQKAASDTRGVRIRVLLVDNQSVSRAGLRHLLASYPDLEVVGEASDHVQAVSEAAELLPQVVLIDGQLAAEQSLEAIRQLRQLSVDIHVLLLSHQENEEMLYEALRAGASGYMLKNIAPDELAEAIHVAARGEMAMPPQLAARLLTRIGNQSRLKGDGEAQENLTAREREVLQLLARGLRNKEIAARLYVSERTVNFHLANIYAKLHVSGRTEALSKALEQGLIKVG